MEFRDLSHPFALVRAGNAAAELGDEIIHLRVAVMAAVGLFVAGRPGDGGALGASEQVLAVAAGGDLHAWIGLAELAVTLAGIGDDEDGAIDADLAPLAAQNGGFLVLVLRRPDILLEGSAVGFVAQSTVSPTLPTQVGQLAQRFGG